MIRLHHRTVEKLLRLRKEAECDGAYRVARRIHAVVLSNDGLTSGEIAETLRAPRSRASEWLRNCERHGYEGLLEGCRPGRPAELTDDERTALSDIIDSGPVSYGFLSGVWTSPMIARVIEEEFGVSYHPGHVRRLLHELGFSVQRPRRVLARADAEKQRKWRL
jgi:transposase